MERQTSRFNELLAAEQIREESDFEMQTKVICKVTMIPELNVDHTSNKSRH